MFVNLFWFDPSRFIVYISGSPSLVLVNTILLPIGETVPSASYPSASVNLFIIVPLVLARKISNVLYSFHTYPFDLSTGGGQFGSAKCVDAYIIRESPGKKYEHVVLPLPVDTSLTSEPSIFMVN